MSCQNKVDVLALIRSRHVNRCTAILSERASSFGNHSAIILFFSNGRTIFFVSVYRGMVGDGHRGGHLTDLLPPQARATGALPPDWGAWGYVPPVRHPW